MLALVLAVILSAADASSLQEKGSQALDRRDYQQAEQIFSQLVAGDPKDFSAYFNLALAETGLKRDDKAIEAFKQALNLKPDLYPAQLNLGLLYLRNNQPGSAAPLFEEAVRAKPGEAKPHFFLAEAQKAAGKWPEAELEYQESIKRDAGNGKAELGLGEVLLHQGKLDDAGPHFFQAAKIDPSLKTFLLEYAVALTDAHRDADALPILEQFPDDAGAREKLGQLFLAAKQPDKAVPQFEAAVRLSPSPANRLALATAYLRNNQNDKAAPLLKEAVAAAPGDWELQMTMGRIYRDQKQYGEAANYFSTATRLKPDAPQGWSEMAGVLMLEQQYGPSLAALDRLRALNAEKPGHLFLRAIILDKVRQLKPALAAYQQFLAESKGQNPDQEFQARGRIKAIEHEVNRR